MQQNGFFVHLFNIDIIRSLEVIGWSTVSFGILLGVADKNIKSVNYNVDVVNGIAYLSGIARTRKEMNLVIAYTKETKYINQLVNYIQLSESLSQ